MPPEYQQFMAQAQQAQKHAFFMGYTAYAAILICAVFAVLIFWKLCQIKTILESRPEGFQTQRTTAPASRRADDDSRFRPQS